MGLALGGGMRLGSKLGLAASRNTLLRVRQGPLPALLAPSFAWTTGRVRKRQTCGTVLIDLERRRQMALLCLLDALRRDGRSQALVAAHSPIVMSCPGSDLLWIDDDGVARRALDDIPHWRDMRRFMRDPEAALHRLLD